MISEYGINRKKKVVWIKDNFWGYFEIPFNRLKKAPVRKQRLEKIKWLSDEVIEVISSHEENSFKLNLKNFQDYKRLKNGTTKVDRRKKLIEAIKKLMKENNVGFSELAWLHDTSAARMRYNLKPNGKSKLEKLYDIFDSLGSGRTFQKY